MDLDLDLSDSREATRPRARAPLPPLPQVGLFAAAGQPAVDIFAGLAQWALLALPAADGICVVAQTPAGAIAGSAGLADDLDPTNPFTQDGIHVAACRPLTVGNIDIGAVNVYVCSPSHLDETFRWRTDLVAAVLAAPVAATLIAAELPGEPAASSQPDPLSKEPHSASSARWRRNPRPTLWQLSDGTVALPLPRGALTP